MCDHDEVRQAERAYLDALYEEWAWEHKVNTDNSAYLAELNQRLATGEPRPDKLGPLKQRLLAVRQAANR